MSFVPLTGSYPFPLALQSLHLLCRSPHAHAAKVRAEGSCSAATRPGGGPCGARRWSAGGRRAPSCGQGGAGREDLARGQVRPVHGQAVLARGQVVANDGLHGTGWQLQILLGFLKGQPLENYVDSYYSVEKFKVAYESIIPALTDKSQWQQSDYGFFMHPPLLKSTAGRRKNQRFKGYTESVGGTTHKKGQHRCPICSDYGHHWRSCKNGDHQTRKRRKVVKLFNNHKLRPVLWLLTLVQDQYQCGFLQVAKDVQIT